MINSKTKDFILNELTIKYNEGRGTKYYLSYQNYYPAENISREDFDLIISQFVKNGLLIESKGIFGGGRDVQITADLIEFQGRGGFATQDEILRTGLEKLGYEIDALSKEADPSLRAQFVGLLKIVASLTTAFNSFR